MVECTVLKIPPSAVKGAGQHARVNAKFVAKPERVAKFMVIKQDQR